MVNGVSYSSSTLSTSRFAGVACDSRKEIVLARFGNPQTGKRILVRYQRAEPGDSILILDDLRGVYIVGVIGAVLMIGGLIRTKPASSEPVEVP